MNAGSFTEPSAGQAIRTLRGYDAFVPAPPPRRFDATALALDLSRADGKLSELSGVGSVLPNPHLLIRPYVRREALASTRIEGTRAELPDVLFDEVSPTPGLNASADVVEVRNYVDAIEFGIERSKKLPLAGRLEHLQ